MNDRQIFLTLPILNEYINLPVLIACLKRQIKQDFLLIACVNNYDHWWDDDELQVQCEDNQKSLDYLLSVQDIRIEVIDRSSPGNGWTKKKGGVGWARKIAMDRAAELGDGHDLMLSIDADTDYPVNYIASVHDRFEASKNIVGLAIPYYHMLANDASDRLILRYEMYMRYYLLNMMMIHNPYAFTAIGSAMANTIHAYHKIGGITPVKSGEDFYFLQKLAKNGSLGLWVDTVAKPSPRFSSRVIFGTGPALIKGASGNWDPYPFYEEASFVKVQETFNAFQGLFEHDRKTPMDDFLKAQFNDQRIWDPLRKNYRDKQNFIKACTRKVDGLRILQFLRKSHKGGIGSDEKALTEFIERHLGPVEDPIIQDVMTRLSFQDSPLEDLELIRNLLYRKEKELRMKRGYLPA